MFEKESEKAGNEKIKGNFTLARCTRKSYKDGFKDGAEFGYNKAMNEAKGIIKDLFHCLPKENIEGVYEVTEVAEQFLRGIEE